MCGVERMPPDSDNGPSGWEPGQTIIIIIYKKFINEKKN